MKKIITILLLGCFFIYHFGFYSFYLLYQYKIENDWNKKVYLENYGEKMVLRIPLRLPYSLDQEEFMVANIPFKKNGKSYRVIKKRFINDTFELLYVSDMARLNLDKKFKNWIISLTPENSSDKKDRKVLTQSKIKDYLPSIGNFYFLNALIEAPIYGETHPELIKPPVQSISIPPP